MHDVTTSMAAADAHKTVERLNLHDLQNYAHLLIDMLEHRNSALLAICQTNDSGPWIDAYRAAGGGYEGLQAIARTAMETEPSAPSPADQEEEDV